MLSQIYNLTGMSIIIFNATIRSRPILRITNPNIQGIGITYPNERRWQGSEYRRRLGKESKKNRFFALLSSRLSLYLQKIEEWDEKD